MLLAPVVTEAGFRLETRVDWTIWYPLGNTVFRFASTRLRSDPSPLIFYLLLKPKMAPVNVSVP